MFTVLKSFSGKVSGSKGHVIEIKNKNIIADLLRAGYIEEYTEKNKNQAELKKENETLKKELEELKKEIEALNAQLAETTNVDKTTNDKDLETPIDPQDNQKDK